MIIDFKNLSKDYAVNIPFDGINELSPVSNVFSLSRITNVEIHKIPSNSEKSIKLRKNLQKLFFEKAEGSYVKLEIMTQIKEDTFRRWAKGTREIKRINLAKFIVGLGIGIETAEELFCLSGHALDCKNNRFDFIVAYAINNKDDIEQFGKDVKKYCDIDIF